MKKLILASLAVILLATPVLAEETTRGNYQTPCPKVTEWLNSNEHFSHSHSLDKEKKLQKGLGMDIVAYESQGVLEEVFVEGRWNHQTKVTTANVVAKVNLWRLFKK